MDDWDDPSAFSDIADLEETPIANNGHKPRPAMGGDTWQVFEVVDSRIIHLRGLAFTLDLVNTETGEEAIIYFNNVKAGKGKSGYYAVERNSKFARLYRLTFGMVKNKRLSQANQLLKHFIGERMTCKTTPTTRQDGTLYQKAIDCQPLSPVLSDEYTETGMLKAKKRQSKPSQEPQPQKQEAGNFLGTGWEFTGNFLGKNWEQQSTANPHEHLGCNPVSTTDNCLMTTGILITEPDPASFKTKNNTGGYDFERMPNESLDSYYDRVLEETW